MTQENVELVRRAYEELQAGLERGDPGAIFDLEFVADDYEWIVTQPLEGRSVWRGREGVVEFLRVWAEQFDDWSFQVADLIDASDDRVVALMHQSATGKESRVPVEWDSGVVSELRDGRIIRARNYRSQAEALKAAGLRE
jgi:ketosteroid isomerase-like protein